MNSIKLKKMKDTPTAVQLLRNSLDRFLAKDMKGWSELCDENVLCLLYTSPSPRDGLLSRMPSSA